MEYRLPDMKDEKEIKKVLEEYFQNGERDVVFGQDLLMDDYRQWVAQMRKNAAEGNGDWKRSLLLLCCDPSGIVGLLCVRYELAEELEAVYGNIGYSVRPSKRKKGYGTEMLRHALEICKEKKRTRVILGCHSNNIASAAVIKKCGGVLIKTVKESEEITSHYYEIKLSDPVVRKE